MTGDEYRAQLARLGLSITAGAGVCGVDVRTSRRWANDERDIPDTARRLMWACERYPALLEDLREWAATAAAAE